jgi:hypothetical protein
LAGQRQDLAYVQGEATLRVEHTLLLEVAGAQKQQQPARRGRRGDFADVDVAGVVAGDGLAGGYPDVLLVGESRVGLVVCLRPGFLWAI